MSKQLHETFVVDEDSNGQRLDKVVASQMSDYSRSVLQAWIKQGQIRVNGEVCVPKRKVLLNEKIEVNVLLEEHQAVSEDPEPIDLNIVYEDDTLLVVNKPRGLVMHPAPGTPSGTVQNALLHHNAQLVQIPRAGIVHRLDKDTTGLFVVAKTLKAHASLVDQLQARSVTREYDLVVLRVPVAGGSVDEPIGRHPTDRKKMAVREGGKHAVTHYRVREKFRAHAWLRAKLETGRTHQIRVHMQHRRFPLVGDHVYGGRLMLPAGMNDTAQQALRRFSRQALNATKLSVIHPDSGEPMTWEVPLPEDMNTLIEALREDALECHRDG